jgi:hypothetical protein
VRWNIHFGVQPGAKISPIHSSGGPKTCFDRNLLRSGRDTARCRNLFLIKTKNALILKSLSVDFINSSAT